MRSLMTGWIDCLMNMCLKSELNISTDARDRDILCMNVDKQKYSIISALTWGMYFPSSFIWPQIFKLALFKDKITNKDQNIFRFTLQWGWIDLKDSGLIWDSTQKSVWLTDTCVLWQVGQWASGWNWKIVQILVASSQQQLSLHLSQNYQSSQQDFVFFAQMIEVFLSNVSFNSKNPLIWLEFERNNKWYHSVNKTSEAREKKHYNINIKCMEVWIFKIFWWILIFIFWTNTHL